MGYAGLSMDPVRVSDEQILAAVSSLRETLGSCVQSDLADAVGLSRTAVRYRVGRLLASGQLEQSDRAGSLRVRQPDPTWTDVRLRVRYDPRAPVPLVIRAVDEGTKLV